jgi:hypothetical protein
VSTDDHRPPYLLFELPEQPYGVEIKLADEIFVKQIVVDRPHTMIPQHSHSYDHTSMLAVGEVEVWQGETYMGRFQAPTGILIKAHVKHSFVTLSEKVILYCIHRTDRTGEVEIHEEHHLPPLRRPGEP